MAPVGIEQQPDGSSSSVACHLLGLSNTELQKTLELRDIPRLYLDALYDLR